MIENIEWSADYQTGNRQVDEAHRSILHTCNQMVARVNDGQIDRCAKLLGQCILDCRKHFIEEIELLFDGKSRAVEEHIDQHLEILAQMEKASTRCVVNCTGQTCLSAIFHILISHILRFDLVIANLNSSDD